jgi:hypothetical protein
MKTYSRGYVYTEKRKKNIKLLGKSSRTKEWRNKIGKSHKGLRPSKKTREKMRISQNKRTDRYGEKSHFWKGGVSKLNYKKELLERIRFRNTIQKQVFERDNYTCQICSQYGGDLQVDHIQEWSEYVELRFNIDNCRTLCMKCHYFITFGKPMPKNIKTWGNNLKYLKYKQKSGVYH